MTLTFGIVTIILIAVVAFLAGIESVLDQFQFHQPIVACTLIGFVTGHLTEGVMLGGALQLIALGWANIGAATAPDAATASVASAIIMITFIKNGQASSEAISTAIALAIPLAIAGLFLTMIIRTVSISLVHFMDAAAEKGNIKLMEFWHLFALLLQGLRVAIPAVLLCLIPAQAVTAGLQAMPSWLANGMGIGGGMVAAVGYAMVVNMMATKTVWPFFILGFCIAVLSELTLISLGAIGVALALIFLGLKEVAASNSGSENSDPLGDILNDY